MNRSATRRSSVGRAATTSRLRRNLVVAGLVLLIGLGLLVRGALAAATREQELRREALAARVFDELETSLVEFVAREQARPFVEWRREVVATGTGQSLTRSPLAAIPDQPFVLGYFQIEPDGRFASPMLPGPEEEAASPMLRERVAVLRELSEDLTRDERLAVANLDEPEQAPQQQLPQLQQQQQHNKALPEDLQIQRALDQQSTARQRKNASANQQVFAPDLDQLSNFLGPGNELLEPGAESGSNDALDLRVTGFVVEPHGDTLRMVRTVEISGQRWVQGLAIDGPALEAWLEREVLGPELAGFVELAWGRDSGSDPRVGRWSHRFAAPFELIEVEAELGPVETLSSTGARTILALGVGLGLAVILVLLAIERSLVGLLARAEERERFIAAVTHELRTPLTSIRMYSEMLEQGMVTDLDRQRSYHKTIRSESERLSRLVEQVLTLARLEDSGRMPLADGERAALGTVIEAVVELLRPQAEQRELSIDVELDEAAATASVARDAFAQIVTNLLDNAIKFSPVGGGAIEVSASGSGGTLRLRVIDHGPGVDTELIADMFDPFVRGRREHERATSGTGIGLAVVQSLVIELGGRVVAQNRPSGGLETQVTIPIPNAR